MVMPTSSFSKAWATGPSSVYDRMISVRSLLGTLCISWNLDEYWRHSNGYQGLESVVFFTNFIIEGNRSMGGGSTLAVLAHWVRNCLVGGSPLTRCCRFGINLSPVTSVWVGYTSGLTFMPRTKVLNAVPETVQAGIENAIRVLNGAHDDRIWESAPRRTSSAPAPAAAGTAVCCDLGQCGRDLPSC